jgi:hypothetical protein
VTVDAVRIESPDLHQLTRDLQAVDKKLAAGMKKQMRAVAEPIRVRVAAEASWSRRIPGATKVSTRFTARTQQVIVTVNRKQAPHARPLENAGKTGFFTHPVFDRKSRFLHRRVMVKQQARPFFAKAIESQDSRIDDAITQVARDFERQLGFRSNG